MGDVEDMNYIREINAFYDWLETNRLSTGAMSLWYALMHINNKTGWKNEFTVPISVLSFKTGLSPRAVTNARKELTEAGRIAWTSKDGNQAAQYSINSLAEQLQALYADNTSDKMADKQTDNDTNKSSDNASILNKPKRKRKQNNNPPTPQKEKLKLADLVYMTKEEANTLIEKYGMEATKTMVEILDNYKGANGKTYKSDYKAILSWVVKRYEEDQAKAKKQAKELFKEYEHVDPPH